MELAIIFSDLHVHNYKAFNENGQRLKNCISVLDYIFKLAITNKIKYILMAGDLYNQMQIISTEVVNAVISCFKHNFEENPELQFIAISGNHDFYSKNLYGKYGGSGLQHLEEIFDQFHLLDYIDESITSVMHVTANGNIIEGLCYFEYPEHFIKALEGTPEIVPTTGKRILLMHQVVASGLPIEDHIQPDDLLFNRFDMIFNGHIHKSQEVSDKFINVGSPLHRDQGDIGQKKGIWIVDLNDPQNTISFKDLTDMFPQFIQVEEGVDLDEWQSKQYVIRVPKSLADTPEEKAVVENFSTSLQPAEIMTNYCESLKAEKEILEYGLKLLV